MKTAVYVDSYFQDSQWQRLDLVALVLDAYQSQAQFQEPLGRSLAVAHRALYHGHRC